MGDFNVFLHLYKINGNLTRNTIGMDEFCNCMNELGVTDLRYDL